MIFSLAALSDAPGMYGNVQSAGGRAPPAAAELWLAPQRVSQGNLNSDELPQCSGAWRPAADGWHSGYHKVTGAAATRRGRGRRPRVLGGGPPSGLGEAAGAGREQPAGEPGQAQRGRGCGRASGLCPRGLEARCASCARQPPQRVLRSRPGNASGSRESTGAALAPGAGSARGGIRLSRASCPGVGVPGAWRGRLHARACPTPCFLECS